MLQFSERLSVAHKLTSQDIGTWSKFVGKGSYCRPQYRSQWNGWTIITARAFSRKSRWMPRIICIKAWTFSVQRYNPTTSFSQTQQLDEPPLPWVSRTTKRKSTIKQLVRVKSRVVSFQFPFKEKIMMEESVQKLLSGSSISLTQTWCTQCGALI